MLSQIDFEILDDGNVILKSANIEKKQADDIKEIIKNISSNYEDIKTFYDNLSSTPIFNSNFCG
jgi:archaellum component FlaC